MTDLLHKAELSPRERVGEAEVGSVVMDSRQVEPGALFVCMPGGSIESTSFIAEAKKAGATAAIVFDSCGMQLAAASNLAAIRFDNNGLDYNEALWRLCRAFFDRPTQSMKVVGVTGTNGKTTTAWLLRDMLNALSVKAGYLGTLGFQVPGESHPLANTTPFTVELYNLLNEARTKGTEALAMEVSSHALAERRADGVEFDVGIFTNLTQDHLDYHLTMEAYAEAKRRLFVDLPKQSDKRFVGVLNVDEPIGERWAVEQNGPSVTYGIRREADLVVTPREIEVDRMRLKLDYRGAVEVDIPIGGHFNVFNCVSAAAGMIGLGYDLGAIGEALPKVHAVPGRFEAIPNGKGIGVLVDYAHTPDAIEKLLDSVRELNPRRIISVFGCGGDRDANKRPKMARAASERSDVTILTSDNPRTEDPMAILAQMRVGLFPGCDSFEVVDRREAIFKAVKMAEPGDVVVIAGKGHENYQIIGQRKFDLDDRELAREALY